MKIVIVEKVDSVQTYQPGQVVVNHAKEHDWCRSGLAKPMVDFTPPAKIKARPVCATCGVLGGGA
jgi:hypothetical protein